MRRTLFSLIPAAASCFSLPSYRLVERGEPGTRSWRLFAQKPDDPATDISAWHHIPRRPAAASPSTRDPTVVTFVNEIPVGTRAKLELLKSERHNPIAQDIFKKKPDQLLRFFSYGNLPFNYGFIPQTWENPDHVDVDTKCRGDGDPIDVVFLGPKCPTGVSTPARVLGILGLIDEGETDWKIITAPVEDGNGGYKSIRDVPASVRDAIVDWYLNYKTTDGKKQNEFAFGGEFRDAEYALKVIEECAQQYDALMKGEAPKHDYYLD